MTQLSELKLNLIEQLRGYDVDITTDYRFPEDILSWADHDFQDYCNWILENVR